MHFCSSLDATNGPPLPPQILFVTGYVYWVVGGGGGGWAQLELTDAL